MCFKMQAIIFDLGRVLIDVDVSRGLFGLFPRPAGGSVESIITQIIADPLFALFNTGKLSPVEFHLAMMKKFSLNMDFNEFKQRWCDIFDPMPSMGELVASLKGKVRLGMLSDTDPIHWDYIRNHFDVVSHFDNPTLSFKIGYRKPALQAYQAAIETVGVEPRACLYVDDLPENVRGAQEAGLDAIQFTGVNDLVNEISKRKIDNL